MLLCFAGVTLLMVLLPVLPALIEWHRATDALPLRVVRDHDGSAEHFALRFREFILDRMGEALRDGMDDPAVLRRGTLAGGGKSLLIGCGQVFPTEGLPENREIDEVVAALGSVSLPANAFLKSEVYAKGDVHVGDRTACRAVLAEHDLALGSGCAVLRWAHAEHDVVTGPRARLWGRLTAGHQIVLGEDSVFTRLHAPRIVTGFEPAKPALPSDVARAPLARPDDARIDSPQRWMTRKVLAIPEHTAHVGDLIAESAITVGRGSQITGSLKTHKTLLIEPGCVIDGTVIAMQDMTVHEDASIAGPVVGESTVTIASGCVIGTPERPTTITAPRIRLATGVVIYGSVWSREDGHVLSGSGPRPSFVAGQGALRLESAA